MSRPLTRASRKNTACDQCASRSTGTKRSSRPSCGGGEAGRGWRSSPPRRSGSAGPGRPGRLPAGSRDLRLGRITPFLPVSLVACRLPPRSAPRAPPTSRTCIRSFPGTTRRTGWPWSGSSGSPFISWAKRTAGWKASSMVSESVYTPSPEWKTKWVARGSRSARPMSSRRVTPFQRTPGTVHPSTQVKSLVSSTCGKAVKLGEREVERSPDQAIDLEPPRGGVESRSARHAVDGKAPRSEAGAGSSDPRRARGNRQPSGPGRPGARHASPQPRSPRLSVSGWCPLPQSLLMTCSKPQHGASATGSLPDMGAAS